MLDLPTGVVTLLFTDIEGSTRLWEEQPAAMADALAVHDAILHEEIADSGGVVFKTVGDAFHAAFASGADAISCALSVQRRLLAGALPFRARVALHSGEPQLRADDYFGQPVNRVARILATAHGGQVLVSQATKRLVGSRMPVGATLLELGAHRLKDLAESEELFQLSCEGLPLDFPPLQSLSSHVHNLPAQLTSFVGRDTELAAVDALLDSNARLVTLTGVGGTGKTRIALQAAAERIERYPGGVWWVDLSAVRDAARVLPEIAFTLGLSEAPGADLRAQIVGRLGTARTLVVLDNFEQVLDAAEDVAGLLRAASALQVLATSRASLNVSGEHDYGVGEMGLEEAVSLFAARAQQVQSRFALDGGNHGTIESICRRLEGIPLAIELAAAQSRVLSVSQIEQQLDRRFRTLVSPYRDVSQRQRTLRSTVDWSYDLLTPDERVLFAVLSAFVGGFTFDAAAAVTDRNDVFLGIARLREQSLLRMDDSASIPRFRMLETLREYGQEKLQESGEGDAVSGRHAAYFGDLAAREDARIAAAGSESPSTVIAEDYDNVRASLAWMVQSRRADDAARTACSLGRFWEARGQFREARQLLSQCLGLEEAMHDRGLLARLLGWAGWFADLQNDHDESDRVQKRSLAICREIGDRAGEGRALNHLALTASAHTRFAEARSFFIQSLAIARELGDDASQAARLNNLALLAIEEGCTAEAAQSLREALHIYRAANDVRGIAACQCNLGELAARTEQWEDARIHLEEGLVLFHGLEDKRGVAACLDNLVLVHLTRGDASAAICRASEALAICVEIGLRQLALGVLDKLAGVAESAACGEWASEARRTAESIRGRTIDSARGGPFVALDEPFARVDASGPPLGASTGAGRWEDVVEIMLSRTAPPARRPTGVNV